MKPRRQARARSAARGHPPPRGCRLKRDPPIDLDMIAWAQKLVDECDGGQEGDVVLWAELRHGVELDYLHGQMARKARGDYIFLYYNIPFCRSPEEAAAIQAARRLAHEPALAPHAQRRVARSRGR